MTSINTQTHPYCFFYFHSSSLILVLLFFMLVNTDNGGTTTVTAYPSFIDSIDRLDIFGKSQFRYSLSSTLSPVVACCANRHYHYHYSLPSSSCTKKTIFTSLSPDIDGSFRTQLTLARVSSAVVRSWMNQFTHSFDHNTFDPI